MTPSHQPFFAHMLHYRNCVLYNQMIGPFSHPHPPNSISPLLHNAFKGSGALAKPTFHSITKTNAIGFMKLCSQEHEEIHICRDMLFTDIQALLAVGLKMDRFYILQFSPSLYIAHRHTEFTAASVTLQYHQILTFLLITSLLHSLCWGPWVFVRNFLGFYNDFRSAAHNEMLCFYPVSH